MSPLFSKVMIRQRWPLWAGACGILIMTAAGMSAAHAQNAADTTDMGTRIDRMERDIETLSRSVFKGEKPQGNVTIGDTGARAAQAQLEGRIGQLENDLRDLTNKTEEQGNAQRLLQQSVTDLQNRLTQMDPKSGSGAVVSSTPSSTVPITTTPAGTTSPVSVAPTLGAATPTAATPSATPAVSPPAPAATVDPSQAPQPLGTMTNAVTAPASSAADPAAAYEGALALLKQKDYVAAEKAFNDFIKENPSHSLAPNARYWLGETYFAQKKYDAAARIFAQGYQQFPKGTKAADNLLKLGMSLAAMNNMADACVALQQIAKDFPNGASSVRTRADQELKRLKCGG